MQIDKVSNILKKGSNGIFYSEKRSSVSYPESGNEDCMQIEENSFWFNHRNNIIGENVLELCKDKAFFDIGGGNGFVAKRIQDDGIEVILIEAGETGAQNAKNRGIKNVVCSTIEDGGFKDKSFEAIGLFDVLEHIEDDRTFLNNIGPKLDLNGYVFITVPAYNILWSEDDNYAGHFRRYTLRNLNKLLTATKFEVIYQTYFFSILPFPIFLTRTIPSRVGRKNNSTTIDKNIKEHRKKKGIVSQLTEKVWRWESKIIKKRHCIPFGSSCFIIAKKINS